VETAPATPLPKPTAAAKPAETKAPPPPLAKPQPPATVPQPGKNYLQVAATSKVEADAVVNLLAKKNFRAVLGPVPGQDLYRVLVGPVEEAALAATRTALQEAGFKPFTRRY
jgi:cell division protein FtsN